MSPSLADRLIEARHARFVGRDGELSLFESALRDKVNLDIFWLRDESLEDSANLPDPDVLTAEIVEELRSALSQI